MGYDARNGNLHGQQIKATQQAQETSPVRQARTARSEICVTAGDLDLSDAERFQGTDDLSGFGCPAQYGRHARNPSDFRFNNRLPALAATRLATR